jgi:hypothetical protein
VKCSETLDGLLDALPHGKVLDHGRKLSHVLSYGAGTETGQEEPAIRLGCSTICRQIARDIAVGVGNDLASLKIQESALTPHRIGFENSGYPLQIHGQLPKMVRLAAGHAQPNLLVGKVEFLSYGPTMAPRNTLLQPDRALPHPARENPSQHFDAYPDSFCGESQAKTQTAVSTGTSLPRAVR